MYFFFPVAFFSPLYWRVEPITNKSQLQDGLRSMCCVLFRMHYNPLALLQYELEETLSAS